jgi:hypothetical protein
MAVGSDAHGMVASATPAADVHRWVVPHDGRRLRAVTARG